MDDHAEIALENLQAANSKLPKKLNGYLYRDDLPTRDEVLLALGYWTNFAHECTRELIARGWLKVRE